MKLLIFVYNSFRRQDKKLIIWKYLVIFVLVFSHRLTDSSLKIPEERAAKVATRIERELFSFFRDTDSKYKNKYRSLMFNLKDPKNNVCITCLQWFAEILYLLQVKEKVFCVGTLLVLSQLILFITFLYVFIFIICLLAYSVLCFFLHH